MEIRIQLKITKQPFKIISKSFVESHMLLIWKCNICGENFECTWGHIYNGRGCSNCTNSIGELRIRNWLEQNKIKYKIHKTFPDLLGVQNGRLSYDFYLPKYNLLIEYQGRQHEEANKCWRQTQKDFEQQQEHDRRKKQYATNNKYNFLEIWYKQLNKIENILEKNIHF